MISTDMASHVIDMHVHLLPGIDDGPHDIESSLRLARALLIDGVIAATVTPHVSGRYPNNSAVIEQQMSLLVEALAAQQINLPITIGAEIALDQLARLSDDELLKLSLAGRRSHLLLEVPYAAWPMDIEMHVSRVESLGMTAVLAHPERCAAVQADATPLRRLIERGVMAQISAGSLSGSAGDGAKRTAIELIPSGAAHLVASDAHGAARRMPRMTQARQTIADDALSDWLMFEVPTSIIEHRAPSPRPSPTTSRRPGLRSIFRSGGRRRAA